MEKLGEGYYYRVYALGNARVLKRQTTSLSKLRKLVSWYNLSPAATLKAALSLHAKKSASLNQSKRLAAIPALQEALGNPRFVNTWEYEQDRAIPLQEFERTSSDGEFLRYVDEYTALVKSLWEYGYADKVFNFTLNAGVSRGTGKVILLDFNEFTERKEKAADHIRREKWRAQASLKGLCQMRPELAARVAERFAGAFTLEELDRCWCSQLS